MKRTMIALAALACACAPAANDGAEAPEGPPELAPVTLPVADGAGNRMEALRQSGSRWCTGDDAWCVETADGTPPRVLHGGAEIALPAPGEAWPNIVRIGDDAALVGVASTTEEMYSGGDARATWLTLYEVSAGAAREVLRLPLSAAARIRACFSEEDYQSRAQSCHDEYAFDTRVSLDESVASGRPHIVLETAAATYPGRVSRSEDSLERPPLEESDLVWARDDTCSYRRTFAPGANGAYAPNEPLPACADYLEP